MRSNLALESIAGLHTEDEPPAPPIFFGSGSGLGKGRVKNVLQRLAEQADEAKLS